MQGFEKLLMFVISFFKLCCLWKSLIGELVYYYFNVEFCKKYF